MRSPRYHISIGTTSQLTSAALAAMVKGEPLTTLEGNYTAHTTLAVPCERLGIDPVSIRRASLDIDVLQLEQHRVRGSYAVELGYDTPVRFYRELGDGSLRQLFVGRVVDPMDANDPHAKRRVIQVHGPMQLAKELLFHRGGWTPMAIPLPASPSYPFYGIDEGPAATTHLVAPFFGFNYYRGASFTARPVKYLARQTVLRAIQEWQYNFQRAARRVSTSSVWLPVILAGHMGDEIWPGVGGASELSYLDMLSSISKALPDLVSWVDYSGLAPVVQIHRGAFLPVTTISASVVTGLHVRRSQSEEFAAMQIYRTATGNDSYTPRLIFGAYPSGQTDTMQRRVLPVDTGWNDVTSLHTLNDRALALVASIGAVATAPKRQGTITLQSANWDTWHPGATLSIGGVNLTAQEIQQDLATEMLTISVGPPRHLGSFGSDTARAWLQATLFGAAIPTTT